MRDVFFQSIAVQPPKIAGVRLLPFSVGHEYLLRSLANPIITGGKILPVHLLSVLRVCSRTWQQNTRMLFAHRGYLPEMWFAFRRRKSNWAEIGNAISAYVNDYSAIPALKEPYGEGAKNYRKMSAPWELQSVRVLCSVYGYSFDAAMNCPVGMAVCLSLVDAEANGDTRLESPEGEELVDLVAAANAASSRGDKEEAARLAAEAQQYANKMRGL